MVELHKQQNKLSFDDELKYIKIECPYVIEELIRDLCVYLQAYGSSTDIQKMEEKYDFDYEEVLKEMERL